MRMPDPRPFGETSFLAIVRAICSAEPVNVFRGGAVESVFTRLTQRRPPRFLAAISLSVLEKLDRTLVPFRRLAGPERAEIAPSTGLWVRFSRIQPIFTRLELADHVVIPPRH